MSTHPRRLLGWLLLCVIFLVGCAWILDSTPFGKAVQRQLWALNARQYYQLLADLPNDVARDHVGRGDAVRDSGLRAVPRAGSYSDPLTVRLEADHGGEIRYTLDGSVPTTASPRYLAPLHIEGPAVIRARILREGSALPPATFTYVVGPRRFQPVVHLVADPDYLFDKHAGIYANPLERGFAWERPASLHVHLPDGAVLGGDVSIRIHGNASRKSARKSFRVYARRKASFDIGSLLEAEVGAEQAQWILRHPGNPGQIYRDELARHIGMQIGVNVLPSRTCLLYVDGKPWGVAYVRPRTDDTFLRSLAGAECDLLVDAMASPDVQYGDAEGWRDLWETATTSDMADPANWDALSARLDVDALLDLLILQSFIANHDWPHNNSYLFRPKREGARWTFLFRDGDGALNYRGIDVEVDSIAWILRSEPRRDLKRHGVSDMDPLVESTALFRALFRNPEYRAAFVARYIQRLSGPLSPSGLEKTWRAVRRAHAGTKDIELLRWSDAEDPASYLQEQIDQIETFLRHRTAIVSKHLETHFPQECAATRP